MNAHTYRSILLIVTLSLATISTAGADTTTGLVAYWALDDATGRAAADSIGGHDGRLQGNATWTDGLFGGALLLDGDGDYVDCGSAPAFNLVETVTVAAWVQARGDFSYPEWWSGILMRGGTESDPYGLYYGGVGKQLGFRTTGASPDWFTTPSYSAATLFDGDWHHVAAAYDGKTKTIYLDGVPLASTPATGKIALGTGRLLIGAGRDLNPPTQYAAGRIDDVRLYARGLLPSDIEELVPVKVQARWPDPANGANAVRTQTLKWTAGQTAMFHDVYLGQTPNLGPADLVANRLSGTVLLGADFVKPGVTYYWRVDEVERDGKTTHRGNVWTFTTQGLTAYLPQPADQTVDASPTSMLVWLPGYGATTHHVYFSSSSSAVQQRAAGADKGTVTNPTFAPGALNALTTYYWAVDEVGTDRTVQAGPVWTFTTYLPVDDFESYTYKIGQQIGQTWIDGSADHSSGSTVGYLEAPFTEQAIVYSGSQAMPFEYNDVPLTFSAASRTFSPPVDWTVGGADRLALFVRGKASNQPVQLYLSLTDAAGQNAWAIPNDNTLVTTPQWNEWRIPIELFQVLGVNMTQVARITIGVYDVEKYPGATGMLYLDDIRVIRSTPVR